MLLNAGHTHESQAGWIRVVCVVCVHTPVLTVIMCNVYLGLANTYTRIRQNAVSVFAFRSEEWRHTPTVRTSHAVCIHWTK